MGLCSCRRAEQLAEGQSSCRTHGLGLMLVGHKIRQFDLARTGLATTVGVFSFQERPFEIAPFCSRICSAFKSHKKNKIHVRPSLDEASSGGRDRDSSQSRDKAEAQREELDANGEATGGLQRGVFRGCASHHFFPFRQEALSKGRETVL